MAKRVEDYILAAENPEGKKQRRPIFKRKRGNEVLTREQVKAIKKGRKILRKDLKKQGVWVYGLDMDGETWCRTDLTGSVALVVGSEGRGISRLVKEQCDFILSLPMAGQINSLNASVATGIVLYEAARQRQGIPAIQKK